MNHEKWELHDAGYDSFSTGACFIAMINFLTYRQVKLKKNNVAEKIAVSQNQIKDNQIKHFFNKIYKFDIYCDIQKENLNHQQQFQDSILFFRAEDSESLQSLCEFLKINEDFKIYNVEKNVGYIEFLNVDSQFQIEK
jgi:hypothetical protein